MTLKNSNIAPLIHIITFLLGLILVLVGVQIEAIWLKTLLEAIGIGFIAGGVVNFIDYIFTPQAKPVKVELVTHQRGKTPQELHRRKYHAEKVDILAVGLQSCLREILDHPEMLERVFRHQVRLRLIFCHPQSDYLIQRAKEDNVSLEDLKNNVSTTVELAVRFYVQIISYYTRNREGINHHAMGNVRINLINNMCPYITIDRSDNEILWGLYSSETTGVQSPLFRTTAKQDGVLFNQLKQHFSSLLALDAGTDEAGKTYSSVWLVNMAMGAPTLNYELAAEILGEEKLNQLLGEYAANNNH